MITLELQDDEAELLLDALGMRLEEMSDTKEAMIEDDRTLCTLEDFVDTIQQHDINTALLQAVRNQLLSKMPAGVQAQQAQQAQPYEGTD